MFDLLVIGGGVSGVSCSLLLGSAQNKPFASDKKIGLIAHQKASSLQNAIFYNAYGVASGKLGSELLDESLEQLTNNYPHVMQIHGEKVIKIEGFYPKFKVITISVSFVVLLIDAIRCCNFKNS